MNCIINNLRITFPLILLLMIGLFWSCEDSFDDSAFVTDVSVDIISFQINNVNADINNQEGKIILEMNYGTDLTSLIPEISLPVGATVNPENGKPVDFSNVVKYRVTNGNIYKSYDVKITTLKPIESFSINGFEANINHNSKIITLVLPEGTDLTALEPEIVTSTGVSVTPDSGELVDFSEPVVYTVTSENLTEEYKAVITTPTEGPVVAFLGTSLTRTEIINLDEIEASNWLFEHYPQAQYLSFSDISNGSSLEGIDVIWWHYDEMQNLPTVALSSDVTSKLKDYLANGGKLLLSTFASQYLEALGIIPSGKGPNNVFGDFLPNGFVDGNDWGMSFLGHEDHPIFVGLETYSAGKANLLEGGTFRLNHTAWWFLPEWGGYGNGEGWRNQTGGNNLASEAWDDNLDGRVTIAEFFGGDEIVNTVVISMGAYDWYNEIDSSGNSSKENGYIDNIKILTENSINYLISK